MGKDHYYTRNTRNTRNTRAAKPDGNQGMRESFRWVIVGLLVLCMGGLACATYQVRRLRGSLAGLQTKLQEQTQHLAQTTRRLAETQEAYERLQATLSHPTLPVPPPPAPAPVSDRQRRPVPIFSRDSQFAAKPARRRWPKDGRV